MTTEQIAAQIAALPPEQAAVKAILQAMLEKLRILEEQAWDELEND